MKKITTSICIFLACLILQSSSVLAISSNLNDAIPGYDFMAGHVRNTNPTATDAEILYYVAFLVNHKKYSDILESKEFGQYFTFHNMIPRARQYCFQSSGETIIVEVDEATLRLELDIIEDSANSCFLLK